MLGATRQNMSVLQHRVSILRTKVDSGKFSRASAVAHLPPLPMSATTNWQQAMQYLAAADSQHMNAENSIDDLYNVCVALTEAVNDLCWVADDILKMMSTMPAQFP